MEAEKPDQSRHKFLSSTNFMKFRKLILCGAFALALTASFAFKVEKEEYVTCSIKDPINPYHCITLLLTDDDCSTINTGPQCTAYLNTAHPEVPAYGDGFPGCVSPLYHAF